MKQRESAGAVSQVLRCEAVDAGGGPILSHALSMEENGGQHQPGRRLHPNSGLPLCTGRNLRYRRRPDL